jgi:hypothetical protein
VECGESFTLEVPVSEAVYNNNDHEQVCPECQAKEDEQDDMKSHPCECGLKECPDCFQEKD